MKMPTETIRNDGCIWLLTMAQLLSGPRPFVPAGADISLYTKDAEALHLRGLTSWFSVAVREICLHRHATFRDVRTLVCDFMAAELCL